MPLNVNTTINSRTDMIAAIRTIQSYIGRPVSNFIDDQGLGQEVIKLQQYLATVPDSSTTSGFKFDPAAVRNALADHSIPGAIIGLQRAIVATDQPTNYMSFSEDVSKFNFITGGTGAAIPRVFSAGSSITVGSKQQLPDIPGGEAGKGFTCTGLCRDPDSNDFWVGNFGSTRGSGGNQTPTSIVRVNAAGSALVTQIPLPDQTIGGLQGVTFVTSASLRCLAYVSGANSSVYFINRDGSVPRGPLVLSFVPNALAWDDVRQGFWVSDSSNGDVWLVSEAGVLMSYADFNGWGGPLDHICVDPSRGTAGYLFTTSGANGSPGTLIAWDIAKDQIVDRWQLSDAQAVEGLYVNGTALTVVTDGWYHFFGSAPNTVAPYNANEMQFYTIPAITQWRYGRVYKSGDLVGPYGRQAYHLILDRGDSDTSADFMFAARNGDAAASGQAANIAWSGRSNDPSVTMNLGMRLLNAASATSRAFGASYVRQIATASPYTSGGNDVQLGTRGAQTPDRMVNVIGSALALNLGTAAVDYKPRLGA